MSSTLSIDVSLELETGDTSFSVWSEDDRVVLNAPSLRSLSQLNSLLERIRSLFGPAVPSDRDPSSMVPPLELQVRRAPVARLDGLPADSSIQSIARADDVTVLPIGILKATLRSLG